jgi:hypothetical protein
MEHDADAAARQLASALKEAKKVKAAAAGGQLRELRSSLDGSLRLAAEAASAMRELRESWTFDEHAHFASGAYAKEILALAAELGVQAYESDDRILSYPAIVAVSPADTTVVIDKKKERRTRPSVLVRLLQALQSKPPKFKAQAFLDALATAYDLVVARSARPGATVKLVDVYRVLTVMPGASREYSKQEFARDIYLLDQAGVVETRDGRTLHLPASALTRGSGVLVTVTRSGQQKVYAGISFEEARQ